MHLLFFIALLVKLLYSTQAFRVLSLTKPTTQSSSSSSLISSLPSSLLSTTTTTTLGRKSSITGVVDNKRTVLWSNKGNDDDNDNDNEESFSGWFVQRLERANMLAIRRDAVLLSCFVMGRFLIYDLTTSVKVVPGWTVQDLVWLTGTLSSAVVLVGYWTLAGLLSRSFDEKNEPRLRRRWDGGVDYGIVVPQILVNVALSCPIWLATEHLLEFGPSDIGGSTLEASIGTGFIGLGTSMILGRALTSEWD